MKVLLLLLKYEKPGVGFDAKKPRWNVLLIPPNYYDRVNVNFHLRLSLSLNVFFTNFATCFEFLST